MKHLICCVLFYMVLAPTLAKPVRFPKEDISDAVAKAKSYIQEQKIDVHDFFIQKVEFKNLYEEFHPQFWEFTFLKVPYVKGGHIIVRVYDDGKVDHGFGE